MLTFLCFISPCVGKKYNLDSDGELPTLHLVVTHRAGFSTSDVPMGELTVDLGTIDHDGAETDLWYPLALSGRMKMVTGEVRCNIISFYIYVTLTSLASLLLFLLTGPPEAELQPSCDADQGPRRGA